MRRCVYLAIPILSVGLFACEDGPNQTYSPATGTLFNSGGAIGVVDDASAPITVQNGDAGAYASYSGTSKQEVCGGAELQAQWSKMVRMPIAPPRFMAGLDTAGGDAYPVLTLSQAVNGPIPLPTSTEPALIKAAPHPSRLCQYTVEGVGGNSSDVGGSIQVHWGNNSEVQFQYVTSTQKEYVIFLNPGYSGPVVWTYTDPTDMISRNYSYAINQVLTRTPADGSGPAETVNLWTSASTSATMDQIYRGIVSNYAPDLYNPNSPPCHVTGTCFYYPDAQDGTGRGLVGIRPISFYFYTYQPAVSTVLGNTMQSIYSFNVKFAPYSPANSWMALGACGAGYNPSTCPFDQSLPNPWYGQGLVTGAPTSVPALTSNIGPIAYQTSNGDLKTNCVLKLGDTFGNLLNNCINISSDAATNAATLAKIEGDITHDDQNFTFAVVGINQNYRPALLQTDAGAFTVVSDTDVPQPADTADDFYFDTRAFGPIENDQFPVVSTVDQSVSYLFDYHGSGEINKEYQRLVQTTLAADWVAEFGGTGATPVNLHDSRCLYPANYASDPDFDATNWLPSIPGCTGFEAFLTSGQPGYTNADGSVVAPADDEFNLYNAALGTGANATYTSAFYADEESEVGDDELGFKPGGKYALFCNDPGVYVACTDPNIFDGSLAQVIRVMGHGDPTKVPLEGRDIRFYFRMYAIAKAKYLHSPEAFKRGANIGCTTDGTTTTCTGAPELPVSANIQNTDIDLDYLILDANGGGASRSEYADFTNADATHDPLSFEDKYILPSTNLQSSDFFERLDREERAFFTSMGLVDGQPAWGYIKTQVGGTTNVLDDSTPPQPILNASMLMTNTFGSNTLNAVGFSEADDATGTIIPAPNTFVNICDPTLAPGGKTAYYCATHLDADCGLHAPATVTTTGGVTTTKIITRDNGKPLLEGYCGAFTGTAFTVGSVSPMELVSIQELQQTAIINMPVFDNPYDLTTTNNPVPVLVPWKPQEEGVGYPVMADGQHDVFVQTASLDFTGQIVTPIIDYFPVTTTDDAGNVTATNIQIAAVEDEDFLGDVFLCYDASTAGSGGDDHNPGDLLNVHLYTSVQTILTWMTNHPTVSIPTGKCGLIVRYSPYNNYPDYIQSTAYGVRLGVEQGAGGGRISDATLFTPGTGTPAAQ